MENSLTVVSLTVIVTLVTVVACELNMTASSQTTPSGSASALLDCDSSTCAEFTGQGYTDLLVWLPEPVAWSTTVSLIGTNLLCEAHAQGLLYVVPSTTVGPMNLVSGCQLMNATTEGQLDVCTFSCQDTVAASQNAALEAVRVTRRPFQPSHGDWTLCGLDVNCPSPCPSDYYRGGPDNHCYHYHTTRMEWPDSQAYCTSTDPEAYNVEINSIGENEFIQSIIGFEPWLGIHYLSGALTWAHSGRVVSDWYANWESGEPYGTECATMIQSTGQWYTVLCSYLRDTVCELTG